MANQHVVPNGKNWQVKAEKATKATKNFNTQKAAIAYAKDIAKNQKRAKSATKTVTAMILARREIRDSKSSYTKGGAMLVPPYSYRSVF